MHNVDSIWWPALDLPQVDLQVEEEALKLHRLGIKTWGNLWDGEERTWISRASLIAKQNLSELQLDIIGKRHHDAMASR